MNILQHTLLETEAENVRSSIANATQHFRSFSEEVADSARKTGAAIQQIEGGMQVLQSSDGSTSSQRVRKTDIY